MEVKNDAAELKKMKQLFIQTANGAKAHDPNDEGNKQMKSEYKNLLDVLSSYTVLYSRVNPYDALHVSVP
jgi:hypothetical protein